MAYTVCAKDANLLLSLTPKERKAVLKVLDARKIRSICECAFNLLRGNINLTDKCKLRQLSKHKVTLRQLAKRGDSWKKKRQVLVQKGGGILLPILLSTVLQAAIQKVSS